MTEDWRERFRAAAGDEHADLNDGDSNAFGFEISTIRLKSGTEIIVEPATVTALVGANNVGKSTILREVYELLQSLPGATEPERLSVDSVRLERRGTSADLTAWLGEHARFSASEYTYGFGRPDSGVATPYAIKQAWLPDGTRVGPELVRMLCFYGNVEVRLGVGATAEMRESISDPPSHPVHYLQDNKELLAQISQITEDVFGRPLTLDTLARFIRLRVGRLHFPAPAIDSITPEYTRAMANLPLLDRQGDGMRSMLGQLLPILTGTHPVILIDEPEAFLHPPQAHALGLQLGRLASDRGVQVIVATHDKNLLTGLLASQTSTSVVRLSRTPDGDAISSQLDSEALRDLWTDPVLKYTNVLEGLFHRLVVLAEAEGDCGYLAAALDCPGRTYHPLPRNEVLFVPTGGKEGMAKIARALATVKVPVVAAPDFDRISDKSRLQELVVALGAEWTQRMSSAWDRATVNVRAKSEPALVKDVLEAITSTLREYGEDVYSDEYREAVRAQLRSSGSPWAEAKEYGVAAFKKEARVALEELLSELESAGVVLVREGELESLAPEVATRKGPGWLQAALAQGAQCTPAVQAHVDRVMTVAASRLA